MTKTWCSQINKLKKKKAEKFPLPQGKEKLQIRLVSGSYAREAMDGGQMSFLLVPIQEVQGQSLQGRKTLTWSYQDAYDYLCPWDLHKGGWVY